MRTRWTTGARRALRIAAAAAAVVAVAATAGLVLERRAETAFARSARAPGRLVDIGGRRMHLICAGTGRPSVLLETSGVGTTRQYDAVLAAISGDTTTCTYDRAGMGFSDPADDARSAQRMEDDLAALLRAAAIPAPYVVVAGSLGGLVGELFAREHGADVAGLVMLDALQSETLGDPVLDTLGAKACEARWAAELGLLRATDPFQLAMSDPVSFGLTYRASTWQTICASLRALPQSAAELRAAPPLRPDLLLTVVVHDLPHGFIPLATPDEERAADPRWLAAQHAFAARVPSSRFVVAPRSGHLVASEHPEVVVREIQSMLASLPAR